MAISSSTPPPTLAVPTATDKLEKIDAEKVQVADRALYSLMQNGELLQSLADQSSKYVPPSRAKVLSTLWAMFNVSGTRSINIEDVQRALYANGGNSRTADALWKQLSPKGEKSITAADFATNDYLGTAVNKNILSLQEAVEDSRVKNAPAKSGTLLDFYSGGMNSILDFFV